MALRTWVNTLGDVYARAAATDPGNRTDLLRKGISRAVERADVSLVTKELAVRIQIISLLKSGKFCYAFVFKFKRSKRSSGCQIIWSRKRRRATE